MAYERPSIELIRVLYEDTNARMSDLAAIAGVGEGTVVRYAKAGEWQRRGRGTDHRPTLTHELAETAEQEAVYIDEREAVERRRALVARLYAAAEKYLAAIEARLKKAGNDLGKLDAAVPHFALFSRTVQQIVLIDRAFHSDRPDEHFPRSDDELRRELLRKMDALVARRTAAVSGEPETG